MAKRHTCNDPMLWDEPCAVCQGEEQAIKHRKDRPKDKTNPDSHQGDEKDE